MSVSSQESYMSTAPAGVGPPSRNKLRKNDRTETTGNVLPSRTILHGSGYGQKLRDGHHLPPRLQATIAHAKEKHLKRQSQELSRGNMILDEDGVAHDSEYVQFRSAKPVHLQKGKGKTRKGPKAQDADAVSTSSSSSSSSRESAFKSSPYTYASTSRTNNSQGRYASTLGTTVSAIPSYMHAPPRKSTDYMGGINLAVPRAPSPRRRSQDAERAALSSSRKLGNGLTTSSFQPPAPSLYLGNPPLRLPNKTSTPPSINSLEEATARLGLANPLELTASGTRHRYDPDAARPPMLEGTALDAGVHGMKRTWDGFRLEIKFGAFRAINKLDRKVRKM